jgi:SWI/SNF-related matrix-associated actin-dependent regulator 1 of chromatin subfamily A
MRYCGAKHNGFGWDFNGATNMEELHKILTESCLIRRLKKDVLKELPPKIRSVVPLEIDNRDEYDAIENATKDIVQKSLDKIEGTQIANAEALAKIEYLKQAAVRGKMKAAVAWIRNWLDSGEKLVVFCHHKTTVDALMKEFGECAVKIDGSVPTAPSTKRQEAVDTFQNETWCRLFVGTMAAKEGITLTAASNTCFLEMWWTSGDHVQAEDRVHRIGQEADSVGAYYLIGERTIEETIAKLIDKKAKVLAAVLDGKSVENENLLTALLREYKKTVKIGEVTV